VNPTLSVGELGYEINTANFKIGNGSQAWNSLGYGGLVGPTGFTGPTGNTGSTGPVPTAVSTITINGSLFVQETQEKVNTKTAATGTVTHDWSTGAIFYHTSISANFTANITNLPTTANRSYVVVLYLVQGATAYYANALQVNGASVTMKWPNAYINPAIPNRTEIQSFTLYYSGSAWTALSQLASYG
jgi:hypothetical protein